MSIHSSLGRVSAGAQHRSVLKRYEKLQVLREKGLWDETKSVMDLPKVKTLKIKAKKDKVAKKEDAAATPGAAAPAAGAAAPAAGKDAAKKEAPKAGAKK